ncbi:hypothetical protein RB195_013343 [Necator americanus]|uniref:MARVEL domain-containing protein n=1 Tax=Necator americanus TaxID=51031 RepID=A0ABR1DV25_NECAM
MQLLKLPSIGFPKIACIVLGTIVTALEIYCFIFLPLIPGISLICVAAIVYIVLILTIVKMLRALLILFMIFNMILKIPVLIVTIYVASSIYSYKGRNNCGDYQCSLRDLPFGFLLSGLIAALLCAIIDGILTAALRRFRLLLSGVSSVMLAREDRHHPRTVVATAPQQFVYTTSSANVEYIPANDKTIPVDPTQQPRFAYHETEIPQPQPYLNPSAPPPYPNPSAPQLYSYPSAPQPPPEYKL